jgi:RNA polymerase sigma-70 factor (ECF subfamily)
MPLPASNPLNADGEPIDVAALVRRAQAGDQSAFGDLMQAYYQRVYGVLYGMVQHPADAQDLSQQTWVKVWNKLHTFKGDADFYTWLYRVATFVGLDHIRKRKRQREVEMVEAMEPNRDADVEIPPSLVSRPDQEAVARDVRECFEAALATLSPEHRLALIYREVEGLSYDEIAQVMKCRRGTVMSRIFYARKKIQEEMQAVR